MKKYFNSHYHIATLIFLLILSILFFATYVDLSETIHVILAVLILFVTLVTLYIGVQVGLSISLIILFVIGTTLIAVGFRLSIVQGIPMAIMTFEMFIVFGVIFLLVVILSGLIHLRVKTFFAEREQLKEDLEIYTSLDITTSFDNKTRMRVDIEREMERIKRHDGLFTLLFLEVDHFDEFAQTYGVEEVSHLLKSIAQKLNDTTRTTDRKYRFDTNKFALLLVETKKEDVELVLDKLTMTLRTHRLLSGKYVTLHYHNSFEEYNRQLQGVSYDEFTGELERELVLYAM